MRNKGYKDMADHERTLGLPRYEVGSPAPLTAATTEADTSAARDHQTDVDAEEDLTPNSSSARVRRARVNQHYNEVETGGITGIGSDDAAPLQDVDFELG
jgi:hypothetical protein